MYSVLRKDGSGGTDDSTQCIASGTLIERQLAGMSDSEILTDSDSDSDSDFFCR